jgi:FAD/FMN-containing dehydrogenase
MKINYKKLSIIVGSVFILFVSIIAIVISMSGDSSNELKLTNKIVNDITQLNPVHVTKILRPTKIEEIINAVKNSSGAISIGGGRNSQGGQVAIENSLHIDMRSYNKVISFDANNKLITVEPGISWRDIQEYIDSYDLSVQIMQTYANFTVGGSLSVNVHGRYIGKGPLILSVKKIKLVLADGSIIEATPEKNKDYFYGAIGGYGGVGVIVSATLELDINEIIERKTVKVKASDYKKYFFDKIRGNDQVIMHNLDLYPPKLENGLDVSWYKSDKEPTNPQKIIPKDRDYVLLPKLINLLSSLPFGNWFRENLFDPYIYKDPRVVWRNWEASYDIRELGDGKSRDYTYVLNEYFIPIDQFESFNKKLSEIYIKNDVNILNVSIRHAYKDPGSLMAWAKEEVFAFVCYHRQDIDEESKASVKKWSKQIVDAVIDAGGTYYLPYQPHATQEQFESVYTNHKTFFDFKKLVDPNNRFQNKLWNKYYPSKEKIKRAQLNALKNYYKGEEQTFLTIPEWYLVFNPVEYADFLQDGKNPSDFPFIASIDEYWTLFDKVNSLTDNYYPSNPEYQTMLWVIGISTTVEFLIKGTYESTIGRIFKWTSSKETKEEIIIAQAHRAYADLIFTKAWYEFDFAHWIGKIWSDTNLFEENFLRKTERKLFFTSEFLVKTIYAKLIGFGSKTAFEESDGIVKLVVKTELKELSQIDSRIKVIKELPNNELIISIPRWGPFTDILPKLLLNNVSIYEIAGNDEIALTTIRDKEFKKDYPLSKVLFKSRVLSDIKKERDIVLTPVTELNKVIKFIIDEKITLEHIYDY